jgi:hypothetical protein
MMLSAKRLFMVSVAASSAIATAENSQAGQWLDSILGLNQPVYPVGSPVLVAQNPAGLPYAANQTLGYGNYQTNQPPTYNAPLAAPGFPQTVAGTLPTAAYDTQWGRVPVTYYRPVTAFDPRYGTTVTSLQPCTSYQYQAQRPPVIAPRPISGEYGAQANKWPGITGPGYNPTGLAVASGYLPTYQTIPNSGVPMAPMNPMAPVVSSGSATGMPASAFPTRTFSSPYVPNPYATNQYAASMPSAGIPITSAPATNWAAGPITAGPITAGPIGTGVVPTAAWMPVSPNGYCANGTCVQPASAAPIGFTTAPSTLSGNTSAPGVAPPNIPGATVTPVGPPSFSSTPTASGNIYGGANPSLVNPNLANPALTSPALTNPSLGVPASNGQILPSQQVFPGQPNTGFGDPEATRVPGPSGSSAWMPPNKPSVTTEVQRLPMVAIDKEGTNPTSSSLNDKLSQFRSAPEIPSGNSTPNQMMNAASIPSTLPDEPFTGVQPLSAPADFDSKPKWNPSLLDPDDRTVWEQKNLKRDNVIQLVSGTEFQGGGVVSAVSTSNSVRSGNDKSGFRPVTALQ